MSGGISLPQTTMVPRKGRVGMRPVVDETLKVRAQPAGLRRQFAQLRPDFLFRW